MGRVARTRRALVGASNTLLNDSKERWRYPMRVSAGFARVARAGAIQSILSDWAAPFLTRTSRK